MMLIFYRHSIEMHHSQFVFYIFLDRWHMKIPPKTTIDTILFGVSGKKDAKFYEELKDKVQPEEGE